MAKIITAAEIQKGDLIRVTRTFQEGDRKTLRVYEGVAFRHDKDSLYGATWRTEQVWNLYTREDNANAVIELLDRPEPKIDVPTGNGAVVKYVGRNGFGSPLNRTAIRDGHGTWAHYDDAGMRTLTSDSDDHFADRMSNKEDFTVIFAGVAK